MIYKGEPVAVKMYLLDKDKRRKFEAFTRESKALLACNHQNIVKCYGVGSVENKVFIVLEKCLSANLLAFLLKDKANWIDKD